MGFFHIRSVEHQDDNDCHPSFIQPLQFLQKMPGKLFKMSKYVTGSRLVKQSTFETLGEVERRWEQDWRGWSLERSK